MLSVIKESYIGFVKKFGICLALAFPLMLFSYIDEFLQEKYGFCLGVKIAGIVFLTLIELFVFKHFAQINLGNVWEIVKKTVIVSVYQVLIGLVMIIPIFIFIKIAQHHQILSEGYVFFSFLINIFLGGWFFAKANAVLPLLAAGEKVSVLKFREYTKEKYSAWCLVSMLIYFPYLYSLYLIDCIYTSIVFSSLFVVLFSLFNVKYYQSKK